MQRINHFVFVHMEIESVIGVRGVMGMAILRFFPADHLTHVFKQRFAFRDVLQGKHPFAVDARAANLHAAT